MPRAARSSKTSRRCPPARRWRALEQPVRYAYVVDPAERHVGFIAEDVPDRVATRDRKTLSPMDIVAVLARAVQEQQRTIAELAAKVKALESPAAR